MSGYFFKNINLSIAVLLVTMLISDIFIGFYENLIFVYLSLLLITFTFYKLGKKIISLPISEEHTKKEIMFVSSKISEFFSKHK